MDAWQLRNFMLIAECGSITAAADRLGITQPSLSQQVRRLEDELGVALFDRTARGVALTEVGRLFQEHALIILKDIQRAREEVRRHDTAPSGEVVLGMPASTSQLLGVPLLIAARERFPQIALRLRESLSGAIRGWLEGGRVDLAVLYDAEGAKHLSVKRIADETLFLIGPAGEFGEQDARGVAISPVAAARLSGMQLVLPSAAHGLRRLIDRQAGARDLDVKAQIEIDSLSQIRALVAAGQGYSVLSHAAVATELLEGRLSAARITGVDLRRSVSLVRNPTQAITRASVAIEDLALALLRDMIADGRWITEPSASPPESLEASLEGIQGSPD
jgi:LysR family nitrogen assimilation transcriptional regulator